jgi:hypothetical protein
VVHARPCGQRARAVAHAAEPDSLGRPAVLARACCRRLRVPRDTDDAQCERDDPHRLVEQCPREARSALFCPSYERAEMMRTEEIPVLEPAPLCFADASIVAHARTVQSGQSCVSRRVGRERRAEAARVL